MEIKNCEQYVLAELEEAKNEIEELNDFIECQHKEILSLRDKTEELTNKYERLKSEKEQLVDLIKRGWKY